MLAKWNLLIGITASILLGTSPLMANPFSPKGEEMGTPANGDGHCGGPGGNFGKPEAYVKVVPGYPPGKPDQVQEFVGIESATKKYPAEYAWANRGQFGNGGPAWNEACLGDQHHRLRRVGWENKFQVYCGNLVVDKNNFFKRLAPSPESERNQCDLRFVSSGLWIGDVFLDASKDMYWFPGDQPSLEMPGAVITEASEICRDFESVGMEPQILFYLKGFDKKGEPVHVKFSAWKGRCNIKNLFAMFIGGRESFDPRLATHPSFGSGKSAVLNDRPTTTGSSESIDHQVNPSTMKVEPTQRDSSSGMSINFGKPLSQ